MSTRPVLCLDFDRVLHVHPTGWHGIAEARDRPTPGAMAFLQMAVDHFEVRIISARSCDGIGKLAMKHTVRTWLDEAYGHDGWAIFVQVRFPDQVPMAPLTINNQAIPFTGVFPEVRLLLWSRPWNDPDQGWS